MTSGFPWRRNLAVLWIAQATVALGFTFTFPFFPLYFLELGVETPERAAFLSGVGGWLLGLGMALFSPIWGVLGDRYGRKLNAVRAMASGALVLGLTGFAETPFQLMLSRFFAGALTGVTPTIMALAVSRTPGDRLPFATGLIQSAMFLGTTIGPVAGGLLFDAFGMRIAFFANGIALAAAAVLVLVLVRENFTPPERSKNPYQPFVDLWHMATSRGVLPLLVMVFLVHAANLVTFPALPGVVGEIAVGGASAFDSGVVFMALGLASAISSVALGWLGGRLGLKRVFGIACLAAAGMYFAPYAAGSILLLALSMGAIGLFQGGLLGAVNGLIAITTPRERLGAAFGAAQVAQSTGVAIGPLLGGTASVWFGLRSVFLVNVAMFALLFAVAVVFLAASTKRVDPPRDA